MMNEILFIETLKVADGKFTNAPAHLKRLNETMQEVYGIHTAFRLTDDLIPADKKQGVVKCRIEYGKCIHRIEFEMYQPRPVHSLKIVDGKEVDYHLKYADRSPLTRLLDLKEEYDDILITRNGKITDTSYSNVVLSNGSDYVTPSSFLLNGTKRRLLVEQEKIKVTDVDINDLPRFTRLHFINSMLDIEDNIFVETKNIFP